MNNENCKNCKYLNKYKHNAYIILNFVCRECQRDRNNKNMEQDDYVYV